VRNNRSSWTAIVAAARRAIESEKPAAERICYDPLARKFIGWIPYLFIKTIVVFQERRKAPLPKYILYRYRFFDDYIQKCLASGITQLVNLGAGWDSRAYRGELLERKVRTFEVDHPATQAEKIRKVKKLFPEIPTHVIYVPIDFFSGTLDAILAHGFDRSQRTLFLLEGVTQYLDAGTVESILAWIGSNASAGSTIILDYKFPPKRKQPRKGRRRMVSFMERLAAEERTHAMEKQQMDELLSRTGFINSVEKNPVKEAESYRAGSTPSKRGLKRIAVICADIGERQPSPKGAQPK
jgi:methyltransferase (TIGR00027 family)